MKLIKFLSKFALLFLAFGTLASLYLSKTKEEYITFQDTDGLELY